jgi:hypothetical protein
MRSSGSERRECHKEVIAPSQSCSPTRNRKQLSGGHGATDGVPPSGSGDINEPSNRKH